LGDELRWNFWNLPFPLDPLQLDGCDAPTRLKAFKAFKALKGCAAERLPWLNLFKSGYGLRLVKPLS